MIAQYRPLVCTGTTTHAHSHGTSGGRIGIRNTHFDSLMLYRVVVWGQQRKNKTKTRNPETRRERRKNTEETEVFLGCIAESAVSSQAHENARPSLQPPQSSVSSMFSGFLVLFFLRFSLRLCAFAVGFSSIVFARYTIRIMPNQVRTQRLRGEGSMKKLSVVVSLPGQNNYLLEQETAVREAAQRHGVELRLVNANSDAIAQSQQLLEIIQAGSGRPDGILVEPVNNAGLPRVAEAAVAAGIAWVISNARVDYQETLRRSAKVPVFTVTHDHAQHGRIQGRQS